MKLGRKEKCDTIVKRATRTTPVRPHGNGTHDRRSRRARASRRSPRPRHASGGEPFGALLVRRGFVSEDDVAQALIVQADTGKRLGETLVDMGALNQRELVLVLADLLHMPVVDLRRDNPEPGRARPHPRADRAGAAWPCPSGSTTTACRWRSPTSRR